MQYEISTFLIFSILVSFFAVDFSESQIPQAQARTGKVQFITTNTVFTSDHLRHLHHVTDSAL